MFAEPPAVVSMTERRYLTQPPEINRDILSHPQEFSVSVRDFMEDQFGYREDLIHLNAYARAKYLNQTTSPRAFIGKNDWLYLKSHELIPDVRGVFGMTQEERELWASYFRERQAWAEERGILYIVVIAPEKQSIYPEYLPDVYLPVVENNTRFDNLVRVLADIPEVNFIDLRPTLIAAKSTTQIYRRVDAHWTSYGSYLAAVEIMKVVRQTYPDAHIIPERWLRGRQVMSRNGDLSNNIGLAVEYEEEITLYSVRPRRRCAQETYREAPWSDIQPWLVVMECVGFERGLDAVVFRDSFTNSMIDFIAESFDTSVYLWDNFHIPWHQGLIEDRAPEVIIEQFAERKLYPASGWFNEFDE